MTIPVNAKPIIDWFFENDGAENLGQAAGLDPQSARRVLAQGLPQQLQALAEYAQTKLGTQQIAEAVRIIPHFPTVTEALSMGQGAMDLEQAGDSMAPTLLREWRTQIPDLVAAQTGANQGAVRRLLTMTIPLILSRLSWRDDAALRFLPMVGDVSRRTGAVVIPKNAAVVPAARPLTGAVDRTTSEGARRGLPWWLWLLPLLLLLLLLGGCWLLRPKSAAPATSAEPAKTAPATSAFTINSPANGTEVSANGFTVSGTGPAEGTYTMLRDGQQVGTFKVGKDNTWRTDVLDTTAPAGNVVYTFRDADGKDVGTLNVLSKGPEQASAAPVVVSAPTPGSEVPAGGFSINGTGNPNETYTAYEDGANIGSATVAPDGTWSLDVPGPAAGPHTYTVLDSKGNRVALLPVTVAAGAASAACTDALTISLSDNETVSAPFRFGGRGSGKGYTVSVWRADRLVGTRDVKLTGDCTWSYASNPGGKDGQKSVVRYQVRPTGAATSTPATGKVTLNVSGSGTNFNSKGEYIGPTK